MAFKHMITLTKVIEQLYKKQEEIEALIEIYQEKQEAIEEHAADMGRDMTEKEQERWDCIGEAIDDLETEYDEIQNAIDYISEYGEE